MNGVIMKSAEQVYVDAVRSGVIGFKAKLKAVRILEANGINFEEAYTMIDNEVLEWNRKVKFFY